MAAVGELAPDADEQASGQGCARVDVGPLELDVGLADRDARARDRFTEQFGIIGVTVAPAPTRGVAMSGTMRRTCANSSTCRASGR